MTREETDWVDPNREPHATKVALAIGEELRTHKAIGFQWTLALIASALRDAKCEAYEEAARIAESPCPDKNCCGPGVAAAIRALADSIGEGEK